MFTHFVSQYWRSEECFQDINVVHFEGYFIFLTQRQVLCCMYPMVFYLRNEYKCYKY